MAEKQVKLAETEETKEDSQITFENTDEQLEEQEEELTLLLKARNLHQLSVENRRKYDWEWLVRILYTRGYHFARYNRSSNTVTFSSRTGVRIPINLIAAHMRGVRNQVTSFQPKWEVLPKVTSETAFENARYSGKVLDYIYDKAQIRRKIKEIVSDALWASIGIWQFDIDKDKNIVIDRIDPYDFYVDPNIKSPDLNDPEYGAEFVDKVMQMSLDAVRKNKKYKNVDELEPDNITASAQYKQFLLQVTRQQFGAKSADNETVMVHETWMRERQKDGKIKMRVLHWVEHLYRPLSNQLLDTDQYPFEIYQGDIAPGELYGESWVKNLIPINRAIDALESHIFEFNHIFAKGRFVIDKNSGVTVVLNQNGQIIEKNRGSTVTNLPISPLPPSPAEQIARLVGYLEDVSGVHDATLGRLPGALRSGTAIAELKQADATNQADLVDNLEDFLSRSGRKILRLIAENWTTSKLISTTALGGKPDYFMAAGENSPLSKKKKNKFTFGELELPLAIIGIDNEVRVQVGSWLAYTKEARQEKLKEYFRLGAIDQKTFLEHAEFADIDGIVERTREEALMQANRGQASVSMQEQYGVNLSDEEIALAENELMEEGVDQPVHPGDKHEIHLPIHREKAKNPMVRAHMDEHIKMQRWIQQMNMAAQAPAVGGEQPGSAQTFQMNPPVGAGAPPFQSGVDMVQGGGM